GCSATCTTEHPDTCPGTAIPLALGTFVIKGDTTGAANDVGAQPCRGSASGDFIYAITPAQDGLLTATLTAPNFTGLLYARDACPGNNNANIACNHAPPTMSFMVQS